jgi:hypothetical protein
MELGPTGFKSTDQQILLKRPGVELYNPAVPWRSKRLEDYARVRWRPYRRSRVAATSRRYDPRHGVFRNRGARDNNY